MFKKQKQKQKQNKTKKKKKTLTIRTLIEMLNQTVISSITTNKYY